MAAVRDICPYLLASDGAWRSAGADRDHGCAAVGVSPAPLTLEKQRRLCLTASHATCPAYLVATGLDPGARGEPVGPHAVNRPYPRMAPVALDHGRMAPTMPMIREGRTAAQMALVGLLGIAFVALLIARLPGDPEALAVAGPGSPTPEASIVATPRPTVRPAATPEPSADVTVSAEPTAAPTVAPTATPVPQPVATPAPAVATRTYKVRSGDTLSAIAAEFGTTVRVLKRLNDIDDPSRLRVGQVLKIPK